MTIKINDSTGSPLRTTAARPKPRKKAVPLRGGTNQGPLDLSALTELSHRLKRRDAATIKAAAMAPLASRDLPEDIFSPIDSGEDLGTLLRRLEKKGKADDAAIAGLFARQREMLAQLATIERERKALGGYTPSSGPALAILNGTKATMERIGASILPRPGEEPPVPLEVVEHEKDTALQEGRPGNQTFKLNGQA